MAAEWVVAGLGLLAVAGLAVLARRSPVAWRMARRELSTRRRRGLAVVLGLAVGTAAIGASLATGDSVERGIEEGAYRALGEVDHFVEVEGGFYFPRQAADDVANHPRVEARSDAASPMILESATVRLPARGQVETRVLVVGVDPGDNLLGDFPLQDGTRVTGAGLGPDEVLVNDRLADRLGAGSGDAIELGLAKPVRPLLPSLHTLNGSVEAGAGAETPAGPVYADDPTGANLTVPVPGDARAMVAALLWRDPAGTADLDLAAEGPDGATYRNTSAETRGPVFLNLTEDRLAAGNWSLSVEPKRAADQDFRLVVAVLQPEYDLAAFRSFRENNTELADRLAQSRGPGGDGAGLERTVAGVVEGGSPPGSFLLSRSIFVPIDRLQEDVDRQDEVNVLAVSSPGGPAEGIRGSPGTEDAIEAALDDVAASSDAESVDALKVTPIKSVWVQAAQQAGGSVSTFLTLLGGFTILAGGALVAQLLAALVRRRAPELGLARAVGLTRGRLARLLALEGGVYAGVSVLPGIAAGLALAYLLVEGFQAAVGSDLRFAIPLAPETGSLAAAGAAGFLLALVIVVAMARRLSRRNLVQVLRGRSTRGTGSEGSLRWGAALLGLGLAATAAGLLGGFRTLLAAGPPLAVAGLALAAATRLPARLVYTLAGAAAVAYTVAGVVWADPPTGTSAAIRYPLRAFVLVVGSVVVLVHTPALAGVRGLLRRLPGLGAVAGIAGASLSRERFRSGTTIGMFALVTLVLVLFSVLFTAFAPDREAQLGGYQVEAESSEAVQDLRQAETADGSDPLQGVARIDGLATGRVFGDDHLLVNGEKVDYRGPRALRLYSYDAGFAQGNEYALSDRLPRYSSDQAAYEAVLEDPSLAIMSRSYNYDESGRPGRFEAGATLTVAVRNSTRDLTVVGIQEQEYLRGVWVHPSVVNETLSNPGSRYLVETEPGADPTSVARRMEAGFADANLDARSLRAAVEEELAQERRVFTLFRAYLGLGLVVAVASAGVVTARSVDERRGEIGLLRAVGYSRGQVLRLFLAEAGAAALLGTLLGAALGLGLAKGLHAAALAELGLPFDVPWLQVAFMVGATLVATLLAAAIPARRAARVPPAEAAGRRD